MNRRDLLKFLLSAPIAAELDVERLLWVPKPIVTVPAVADSRVFTDLCSFVELIDVTSFADQERVFVRGWRPLPKPIALTLNYSTR